MQNAALITRLIVVLGIIGILLTLGIYYPRETESAPDPLFYQAYTEITYRDMEGNLGIAKIPAGYRVCHCYSDHNGIGFECTDCELYR